MASTVSATATGAPRFDADALERKLRVMWKSSAGEPEARAGATYRAAMCNLVVAGSTKTHHGLMRVLVDVARRHPSRLFLVAIGDEDGPAELTGDVGALCHLRPSGGTVCSEQIFLTGPTSAGPLVPSAVRALLVGNLPTVLLNLAPDGAAPWLEELTALADLALEDTGLTDLGPSRRAIWERIARDESYATRDLAWARIAPWRQALADAFEPHALLPSLANVREVTIEYEGAPIPSCVPLFVGWLASRLRWTLETHKDDVARYRTPSGKCEVEVRPTKEHAPREIALVRVRADGSPSLDVSIHHHQHHPEASVRIEGPISSEHRVPMPHRDFASCIVGEMHRHEPNPLLRDAARFALAWITAGAA